MPRPIRVTESGNVYHVISRFVGSEWFIQGEEERETYLRFLAHSLQETDWKCLAYAVMSNHIHLAMLAGRTPLATWSRSVNSPFADYINRVRRRIGAVFVRGPDAHGVLPHNVDKLIAYLHNNPVRAGVVRGAADTDWTSHRAYVGIVPPPDWLAVDEGWRHLPFETPAEFNAWVETHPADRETIDLKRLRKATRLRGALMLGTPTVAPGVRTSAPLLKKPSGYLRVAPRDVVEATALALRLRVEELCSRNRSGDVILGRQVAVRAGDALGVAGVDIAAALAISGQAVTAIRRRFAHRQALELVAQVTRTLSD
ncbi:MAG: hypothetical protein SFX73_20390 [Kofleriaceae bacterium]|nr:hypothetical protein [Kofleriaceae bacterium]